MTRLESERLVFRAPEANDLVEVAAALSDFEVSKNLALAPHPYDEKDAKDFLLRITEGRAKGEDYCFMLRRKSDGSLVGACGLHLKNGHFELGYWIAKSFWRQGFATEAAARVLDFAFDELRASEVWAGWYHDNPFSGRVLGKLGFEADHVEKQYCRAREADILCNRTRLTPAQFGRKKAA